MQRLMITAPSRQVSCPVLIGQGLLESEDLLEHCRSLGGRCAVVSDSVVAPLYGEALVRRLCDGGVDAEIFVVASGEDTKSRATKASLEDQMQQRGFGRDSWVLALGGGMVSDLAGFVAATYCRGVPLVIVATTLLAMVDASIGGKNGVNTPAGKNLIGTIYPPTAIFMDVAALSSLPARELRSGLVEVIKHGLIADAALFARIEAALPALLDGDLVLLEDVVVASSAIKREIVEKDVLEHHERRLLNFGHTIGHAFEALSQYRLLHGEAVALGILVESALSAAEAGLSTQAVQRITNVMTTCVPDLLPYTDVDVAKIMETMTMDKKAVGGVPRFILLEDIGRPKPYDGAFCAAVPSESIVAALQSSLGS